MNSIDICNLALGMLGMPRITSFDENNNNAKLCRDFFTIIRDRVLREHVWSFAIRTADLSKLAETSPFADYPLVYALPNDVVRIFGLADNSDYMLAGKKLYTSTSAPQLVYIAAVEDPEEFDSSFISCLQYLLAAEIGAANTRDANLINYYHQQYQAQLAQAKAIDSQENFEAFQFQKGRNTFLEARKGSSGRFAPVTRTAGNAGRA